MVRSAAGGVVAVTTSAASSDRRKTLEAAGVEVLVLNGPGGRAIWPERSTGWDGGATCR